MDPNDLVEAAEFATASEAELARALLESAGIPCFLRNEYARVWAEGPGLQRSLMVPASRLAEARAILSAKSTISDEELAAQAERATPGELPDGE